jgi:hypothetical protein
MNRKTEAALINILNFCEKYDNSPLSAQTHLDTAICLLVELNPNLEIKNRVHVEIINDAIDHINLLKNKR